MSSPLELPARFNGHFGLVLYHQSHGQLLLRSHDRDDGGPRRIDILFKGVVWMSLPAWFEDFTLDLCLIDEVIDRIPAMGFDEARHLLSRTTFGPTPAEIQALESQEYEGAIDGLLGRVRKQARTSPPDWVDQGPAYLRTQQRGPDAKMGPDGKPLAANVLSREQARELRNWWVEEMLTTDQPLVERMVLFWHNHFTSSFRKVRYSPSTTRAMPWYTSENARRTEVTWIGR